jgi:diguanylate cyclase (GGDEF)-like protein
VDGLKATNDSLGHAAGDLLLRRVVETLRTHLRSYDLIVRFGGDEFVCALLALDIDKAAERFTIIRASMAAAAHASISVGLAEYQIHDSLATLLARADQALLTERQQRPART